MKEMPHTSLKTDAAAISSGSRDLMLAVLEDAIQQFGSSIGCNRAEAERWIMSPERQHVFSFAVICETLGLAPSAVRRSLLHLQTQKPPGGRMLRRARRNVRHTAVIQPRANTRGKESDAGGWRRSPASRRG